MGRFDDSKRRVVQCASLQFPVATGKWELCSMERFDVDGFSPYECPSAKAGTADAAVQSVMTSLSLASLVSGCCLSINGTVRAMSSTYSSSHSSHTWPLFAAFPCFSWSVTVTYAVNRHLIKPFTVRLRIIIWVGLDVLQYVRGSQTKDRKNFGGINTKTRGVSMWIDFRCLLLC